MADDTPPQSSPLDLSPDDLVGALQRGERGPQDLITLCGFLGESDAPGYHRLFTDAALTCWVDIPDKEIHHRRRLADEHDAYGERSVVWVKNGTLLVKGEVTVAGAEAEFLTGPWSGEAPWELGDDGVDRATQGQKVVYMASPRATPAGYACCH